MIWQILGTANDAALWFMPFVLFASAVVWFIRERSFASQFALFGASLACAARICHILVPSVTSVSLGNYPEPASEQNARVWFIYIQALNIGLLIFVLSVGSQYVRKNT